MARKEHKALGKPLIGRKEYEHFNSTASGITGVVETMKTRLAQLEEEIKRDEDDKREYEKSLNNLRMRKAELENQIEADTNWTKGFDSDIGPFIDTYNRNTEAIGDLYSEAAKSHKKGIEMLMAEFNYHPAFRRPGDTFSAIPFNPMKAGRPKKA